MSEIGLAVDLMKYFTKITSPLFIFPVFLLSCCHAISCPVVSLSYFPVVLLSIIIVVQLSRCPVDPLSCFFIVRLSHCLIVWLSSSLDDQLSCCLIVPLLSHCLVFLLSHHPFATISGCGCPVVLSSFSPVVSLSHCFIVPLSRKSVVLQSCSPVF